MYQNNANTIYVPMKYTEKAVHGIHPRGINIMYVLAATQGKHLSKLQLEETQWIRIHHK